jgi:hypothetical protein
MRCSVAELSGWQGKLVLADGLTMLGAIRVRPCAALRSAPPQGLTSAAAVAVRLALCGPAGHRRQPTAFRSPPAWVQLLQLFPGSLARPVRQLSCCGGELRRPGPRAVRGAAGVADPGDDGPPRPGRARDSPTPGRFVHARVGGRGGCGGGPGEARGPLCVAGGHDNERARVGEWRGGGDDGSAAAGALELAGGAVSVRGAAGEPGADMADRRRGAV